MRIGKELEYFCTTSRRELAFSLLTTGGIVVGVGDTFLSLVNDDLQSSRFIIVSSEVAALIGASGLSGRSGGGMSSMGGEEGMGVAGFIGLVGNCEERSGGCGSSRVVAAGEGFGGGWCSCNCGRVSGSSGSSRLVAAGLGERSG